MRKGWPFGVDCIDVARISAALVSPHCLKLGVSGPLRAGDAVIRRCAERR